MISAMITAAMTPPLAPIITQGAETLEAEAGINKKHWKNILIREDVFLYCP